MIIEGHPDDPAVRASREAELREIEETMAAERDSARARFGLAPEGVAGLPRDPDGQVTIPVTEAETDPQRRQRDHLAVQRQHPRSVSHPGNVDARKADGPVAPAAELDHQLRGAGSPLAGWVGAIGDMHDEITRADPEPSKASPYGPLYTSEPWGGVGG